MTLEAQLTQLVLRIADEFNAVRAEIAEIRNTPPPIPLATIDNTLASNTTIIASTVVGFVALADVLDARLVALKA